MAVRGRIPSVVSGGDTRSSGLAAVMNIPLAESGSIMLAETVAGLNGKLRFGMGKLHRFCSHHRCKTNNAQGRDQEVLPARNDIHVCWTAPRLSRAGPRSSAV